MNRKKGPGDEFDQSVSGSGRVHASGKFREINLNGKILHRYGLKRDQIRESEISSDGTLKSRRDLKVKRGKYGEIIDITQKAQKAHGGGGGRGGRGGGNQEWS